MKVTPAPPTVRDVITVNSHRQAAWFQRQQRPDLAARMRTTGERAEKGGAR